MKKHRSLRLISLALSLVICLSSFPISVFSSELTGDAVGALKEDVSRRDKYTKHFIDSDGNRYAVVYPEQVHYQNNDEWLEIDNSLTLDSAGKKYESKNEVFKTAFAKNSNDSQLVSIEEDGYKLSWSISFASDTTAEVMSSTANASAVRIEEKQGQLSALDGAASGFKTKENMTQMGKTLSGIRYNSVFNDRVDLRYSVLHGKVEEDVILNSPGAFTSYTLTMNTNGLAAIKQTDNSVEFVNSENETIFTLGAPWMKDTAASVSHEIEVSVIQKGNIAYITYTPDAEWLNDKARLYPVLIDPSFTSRTYTSNIEDTYVYQGSSSTTASENTIKVGSDSSREYVGYVRILNIPTFFDSWYIDSAVLKLFTNSASAPAISLHEVTEEWEIDTLTYSSQPTSDLIAESLDVQVVNGRGFYGFDLISLEDDGLLLTFEDYCSYGFKLVGAETDEYTQIYSSEYSSAAFRPTLVIEYSYYPVPGLEDGGVYSFKNKASNQYLSVQGGANTNGTNVCLSSDDSPGRAQAFRLAYESDYECFRIGAICSSDGYGKVLDFNLSSTATSSQFANLRIYDYDEEDSAWEDDQSWMIVPDTTGNYFSILSKADPNLAITAYGSAGEYTSPGTTATSPGNVFVTEFTGANNQLWTIESGNKQIDYGYNIKSGGTYDKPEGSTNLSFVCPVTAYGETVTWSSSNTNTATVNQEGKVTCLKAGKSIITATVTHTDDTTTQYTATVYVKIADGVYYMLNEETGYRLEYEDTDDYSEGAVMEVYECYEGDEDDPQRYSLFKIKYLGSGHYSIRSMLRNDMGWTFSSDSELVMTNIGASDSGITDATKWCIGYDSNGYYIYNMFHAETVTAPEDSGENIYCDSYLENDLLQHWELTKVTTSMNDVVIYDKVNKLVVDESASFSAAIYSSDINQNGQNGFTWSITSGSAYASIDSSTGVLTAIAPGSVTIKATYKRYTWNAVWSVVIVPIHDGTYFFRNVEFDDKYMQIDNNASVSEDNAILELWDFDGATDQRWEITHEREGYYSIVSVASGKAITAPSTEDASLTQTTLNKTYGIVSNDAQLWMITEVSEGVYKLSPKSDGSYFMAAGDGIFTSDGRNVEKRTDQSDAKDEWMIEKMYTYIVNNYYDSAFLIRNSSSTDILLDCQEIVIGKFLEIYHVNVVMNNYYYTSNGDLCKIDLYGSVTSSNIESACTHSSSCLTSSSYRTKLIEDKGNGSNTVTSVIWTGHRFDDNIGDRSNSSTYGNSVIITPWITSLWDDDSQSYSEVDYATKVVENSFELMHELSHQLSAPDHYCYKDEEDDSIMCGNDYCDECIYGYDEPRHCIMSYRFDISSLSTENTYCDDCKNMIQDHLIDHH